MKKRERTGYGLLMAVIAVLLVTSVAAVAAPNIKERGVLEAVGDNGRSAVIMTRGAATDKVEREHRGTYEVSSYATIINGFGKKAALDTFLLPAKVEFEVEYTGHGPVIKKIRELPQ